MRRLPLPAIVTLYLLGGTVIAMVIATSITVTTLAPTIVLGITQLNSGKNQLLTEPQTAAQTFEKAEQTLRSAQQQTESLPLLTRFGLQLPPFSWLTSLRDSSEALARAGSQAALLAETLPDITNTTSDPKLFLSTVTSEGWQWLDSHTETISDIHRELLVAEQDLSRIPGIMNAVLPHLGVAKDELRTLTNAIPTTTAALSSVRSTLGHGTTDTKRVVILFQNTDEQRTMGGFPGSYALIEASNGTVTNFTINTNIYKLDRIFERQNSERPSPALQTITPWLGFRDSTVDCWFLEDCSKRVLSYFAALTGTPAETVMYINSTVLEDLLTLIGSVTLPTTSGAKEISSTTVSSTLTEEIEQNYFTSTENITENEPKAVLADLLPITMQAVSERGKATALPAFLFEQLQKNAIKLWSANSDLQRHLAVIQPASTVDSNNPNWYQLFGNNIGGMKSSRNVQENATHSSRKILGTTRTEHTLTITRTHMGTGEWPDSINRHHIRLLIPGNARVTLLPQGSGGEYQYPEWQLREAGLEPADQSPTSYSTELGTAISFWASVSPGETRTFIIRWETD